MCLNEDFNQSLLLPPSRPSWPNTKGTRTMNKPRGTCPGPLKTPWGTAGSAQKPPSVGRNRALHGVCSRKLFPGAFPRQGHLPTLVPSLCLPGHSQPQSLVQATTGLGPLQPGLVAAPCPDHLLPVSGDLSSSNLLQAASPELWSPCLRRPEERDGLRGEEGGWASSCPRNPRERRGGAVGKHALGSGTGQARIFG